MQQFKNKLVYLYRNTIKKKEVMKKVTNEIRREVMKEAWILLRESQEDGYFLSWSNCLKTAWAMVMSPSIEEELKEKNVKEIFQILMSDGEYSRLSRGYSFGAISTKVLRIVADKSQGFQSDIASKSIRYSKELSTKQAWCVAYEFLKVA